MVGVTDHGGQHGERQLEPSATDRRTWCYPGLPEASKILRAVALRIAKVLILFAKGIVFLNIIYLLMNLTFGVR